MIGTDFEALQHQFVGQWRAIEQAGPAERRLLMSELAQGLAEWESAQADVLERLAELKRIGYWSALAEVAAAEVRRSVGWLGVEKQAMRQRLLDVNNRIETAEAEVKSLAPEIEAICDELSLSETRLADLEAREQALRQQLEACKRLPDLQAEVDKIRADLDLLSETVQQGVDPAGVLTQLVSMREALCAYYDAYLLASRQIAEQLVSRQGTGTVAPPSPEILDLPSRLLTLDRELKDIDQVLASHLQQQDELDRETKSRT